MIFEGQFKTSECFIFMKKGSILYFSPSDQFRFFTLARLFFTIYLFFYSSKLFKNGFNVYLCFGSLKLPFSSFIFFRMHELL